MGKSDNEKFSLIKIKIVVKKVITDKHGLWCKYGTGKRGSKFVTYRNLPETAEN